MRDKNTPGHASICQSCVMSHSVTSSISRLDLVPNLHISKGIWLTCNRDAQVNSVMEQRRGALTMCVCISTYTMSIRCQHTQSRSKLFCAVFHKLVICNRALAHSLRQGKHCQCHSTNSSTHYVKTKHCQHHSTSLSIARSLHESVA